MEDLKLDGELLDADCSTKACKVSLHFDDPNEAVRMQALAGDGRKMTFDFHPGPGGFSVDVYLESDGLQTVLDAPKVHQPSVEFL